MAPRVTKKVSRISSIYVHNTVIVFGLEVAISLSGLDENRLGLKDIETLRNQLSERKDMCPL